MVIWEAAAEMGELCLQEMLLTNSSKTLSESSWFHLGYFKTYFTFYISSFESFTVADYHFMKIIM